MSEIASLHAHAGIMKQLPVVNPEQSETVARLVREGATTGLELLSECVYVLSGKIYEFTRDQVVDALTALLEDIDCEHHATALEALRLYGANKLDFPDCILAARHTVEEIPVSTFDRKLQKLLEQEPSERL
ncbi:hypothetical protein KZP08_05505 [Bifidobacterium pseudocatenulatum]|nr:hypothetical protein [Bifidobacterium pseudocatenulatum]